MSRASRNGYADGKLAGRADKYFKKYGRLTEGMFLAWLLIISAIMFRYLYAYNELPIKVGAGYHAYRPGSDALMWNTLIVPLILITLVWAILEIVLVRRGKAKRRARMDTLMSRSSDVTPEEFLANRMWLPDKGEKGDFTGIYVLHNLTQDEYYVGQSVHVLQRVRQHFTGHGNGDVYADWKMGDRFTIQTVSLVGSGYNNLNDLEREAIDVYHAYDNGYNRTSGNRT